MTSPVPREVQRWAMVLGAAIVLTGCAGEIGRLSLEIPMPAPFPGPPGSPRLAVRPLQDARELELMKSREGWFLEYLPDEALEPGPVQVVTQALVHRLRASGRFEKVLSLGPDEGVVEPFNPPRDPVPAELILEGDIHTFYVERSTVSNPFLSMMVAPLGLPLAAISGLKILPTPITPILPVTYRGNLTFQVRLRDPRTDAVIWERTVEGISELSETAATDFFKGKELLMKKAGSLALQAAIEKFARQVPSRDWFMARWPKRLTPAPSLPVGSSP